MSTTKHSAFGTETTFHSTDLNAGADATFFVSASAYDNSSALDLFMDFKLNRATDGGTRSAGASVGLWILPAIDGTNYDDAILAKAPAAVFGLDAATTARQQTATDVPIPPCLFKTAVRAATGQAWAASGSTIKGRAHSITTT